jgi:hypothetical protein
VKIPFSTGFSCPLIFNIEVNRNIKYKILLFIFRSFFYLLQRGCVLKVAIL